MTQSVTCGEALMGLLADYGVDTVFGMPGTHTVELYRGIAKSGIRHVQCRNEQGAGFMADGFARATGKPGVITIVTGPGVTNASSAIAQAYCDSQPMIVVSGACATETLGKGWGTVHELDDQAGVTRSFTAHSQMVHNPEELPELVARAFALFEGGRPRPFHLSVPWNVLPDKAGEGWQVRRPPKRPMAHPETITEAAELLSASRRPLILLGGGAVGCGEAVARVAERLDAPVMATNAGKGVLPESHPLSIGCSILHRASQDALASADAVLIIGSEVAEGDHFLPQLEISGQIVRIDIDADELSSLYGAAVPILGDAKAATEALTKELEGLQGADRQGEGSAWAASLREANLSGLSDDEKQHLKVWQALREALPEDAIIMGDMTQLVYTGSFAFSTEVERCWYYSGTYCALGVALPMAIGAKVGAPERAVVAVAGDGGFMFTLGELAVAVEEKQALPVIIWNNHALKEIVDQMDQRQMPRIGVEPHQPDFMALAAAYGCHAARPDSTEALKDAVAAALEADRPTLIEVTQGSDWLL